MSSEDTQGMHREDEHAHGHVHTEQGSHHHAHHEGPITQEEAVHSLLLLGQVAFDAGDYESAAEAYASLLKLEQNETALYNLASFHARGVGVRRDFMEAARLFHQAELMGNSRAGMLCAKCLFDFINTGIGAKRPMDLFTAMVVFVARVYPEAADASREVAHGLSAIANTYYSKGAYAEAAKAFRAAAEFADDGSAQYYLGTLYCDGVGVPQSNLAALYWFDRAIDNDAGHLALAARDEILDAYRSSHSASEFDDVMAQLIDWCEQGTSDIPADPERAARWRETM